MRSEVRILSGAIKNLLRMILETKALGPIETNAILIGCEETKKAVLIDAPQGAAEWFSKRLKANGLHPEMLLLTHSHWDHIGDVYALKEKFNIPVYIHSEDAETLQEPRFSKIKGVEPTGLLEDGQVIEVGNLALKVIHTPGHTPGCVCFYLEKEGVLISGDTLFKGTIGRLDLPTGDPERMWKSLKKLGKLPPETVVYPGHMEPTKIENEGYLNNAEEFFS
jgi:hydroxyacylglutathione hydrolase